jgi:hypothetical protein
MKQPYNPYWVRKGIFTSNREDHDEYYNRINQNENIVIFGYGPFQWGDVWVGIPVYYLEKVDLLPGTPYKQVPDWKKNPTFAPVEAVSWQ